MDGPPIAVGARSIGHASAQVAGAKRARTFDGQVRHHRRRASTHARADLRADLDADRDGGRLVDADDD
ncbi:MAG: hypothetical protein A2138_14780 [Deltaproteobacteria bacterium RBG_16_71_12]|nr:MAG: hypothetical protein A2138_14780 [Deltaproteobacteria bacterium RBG_16_71_12]